MTVTGGVRESLGSAKASSALALDWSWNERSEVPPVVSPRAGIVSRRAPGQSLGGARMVSEGHRVFSRSSSVRISGTLLALLLALTVVGLIPAVFILVWAWGRLELNDEGMRYWPFGGGMAWSDVRRLGVGIKTGTVDRSGPTPLKVSTVHVLLRDAGGRILAVHCANFKDDRELLTALKRRAGVPVEPLKVSFFLSRLSFSD